MSSKIVIYTTSACPKCRALKNHIIGIDYIEMDLTNPGVITELRLDGCFEISAPILQLGESFLSSGQMFYENGTLDTEPIKRLLERYEAD